MNWDEIKTTRYFKEQILKKRPYLKPEWCIKIFKEQPNKIIQPDGRIRLYSYIEEAQKYLRIVILDDGETIHNAFFDRNFKEK